MIAADNELLRKVEIIRVVGYPDVIYIPRLLLSHRLALAKSHYISALLEGNFQADLLHGKNRLFLRDDAFGRNLLYETRPIMESIVGKNLKEQYSFVSYYRRDSELRRHVDKLECQFTVGIILFDSQGDSDKRMYLSFGDVEKATDLAMFSGDAAVFCGVTTPHWRPPLRNDFLCTLLLHYKE
ncbi:MAG: hypothetical protein EOP06_08955 [Proteobacteria bacterium]|nr:MAG: hypothetical protein EOP06_08955 [Pseudomonadota bacterium]